MIPADILRLVPGCENGEAPLAVGPLLRRHVNRNYRVDTHEGSFVVRLAASTDAWLLVDRTNEILLQRAAARSGLAPRVLHADANRGYLVMDYVAGDTWTADCFGDPQLLRDLGVSLRRLHALEPPAAAKLDVMETLRAYAARLAGTSEPAAKLTARLADAASAWAAVQDGRRRDSIVHHDLHATNIIHTNALPSFVDWECAVVSDPLLDVACVCAYYPASRAYADVLLGNAGLAGVRTAELEAAIRVFEIHTWFWYRERRERLGVLPDDLAAEHALDRRLAVDDAGSARSR